MTKQKLIIITVEEDKVFPGRYDILSQVKGFPKWLESIEDGEDATFSTKEEAIKFVPKIKKEIEKQNPDAKVIFKK